MILLFSAISILRLKGLLAIHYLFIITFIISYIRNVYKRNIDHKDDVYVLISLTHLYLSELVSPNQID